MGELRGGVGLLLSGRSLKSGRNWPFEEYKIGQVRTQKTVHERQTGN